MNDSGMLDLVISLLPGLKPKDKITLLQVFDREEDFIIQSKYDIEKILKYSLNYFWDIDEICGKAQKTAAVCRARGIEWVSWKDALYPPLLREIFDPPPVIFYRGRLPDPQKPLLGMVGTRKSSPEAAAQAYNIAQGLGLAGFSVVSGLAIGIDAMSHRGNLDGGVPGYAVLGSGVDEIYPTTNRALAGRILNSGGSLISEYPPGTGPLRWNFPARNRIISALARSVLVVEAPQRSGSLITANFALEHGRDLWVASSGVCEMNNNMLFDRAGTIKMGIDGADVIHSARDVLERWGESFNENSLIPAGNIGRRELISSMANYLDIEL